MIAPLVAIVGPTASGKSAFAMLIAQQYNGEIICADSRTVYQGMDIGTAKPSPKDQRTTPHHLLDIRQPNQPFNAAEFKKLANLAIQDIWSRGRLPIMVGGTGLYVDAVIFDYEFGVPAELQIRKVLSELSVGQLQELCRQKNIPLPGNAQNKRHLVRTIETGGLLQHHKQLRQSTLVVGMSTSKARLHERIEKRAHSMVEAGVIEEVRKLAAQYGWDSEAMKGNIYRIMRGALEGAKSIDDALAEFIQSDIYLAKRQMTWFKRNPHVIWGRPKELLPIVDRFVKQTMPQ